MNCDMAGLKVGIYIFIGEIIKEKGCKKFIIYILLLTAFCAVNV